MSNNYPSGMSTSDLIYVGEIADPDEIDQDDFTDWARDKAIEIIVDDPAFYFAGYGTSSRSNPRNIFNRSNPRNIFNNR